MEDRGTLKYIPEALNGGLEGTSVWRRRVGTSGRRLPYVTRAAEVALKESRWRVVLQDRSAVEEDVMRKREFGSARAVAIGAMLIGAVLCGVVSLAALSAAEQEKDKTGVNVTVTSKDGSEAGLVISAQATAKEAGLPLYPGATPHKEEKNDSSAANLGLWGSTFGFKLVVLKMESSDSPEKVAAYYQKALGKYGTVLNCSGASKAPDDKDKHNSSNKLTCDDDHADAGEMVFKAGTKEKQHLVSVKPNGTGCTFNLLYIEARSDDKTPA
jgi:hypothetical protein